MIEKLGTHLYNKHIFSLEQKEIFVYGMSVLWLLLINWSAVFGISIILGTVKETALFLCLFIPIRKYAGGFHASSALKCFICSQLIIFVFVQLSMYPYIDNYIILLIVALLSAKIILKKSPVTSVYHPLSEGQRNKYTKISKTITLLYVFVACSSLTIHCWLLFKTITLALILQSILLIIPEQKHN